MSESALAVSPDGRFVATFGDWSSVLTLWDAATLNPDTAHTTTGINNAVFSPDSSSLAAASLDGYFRTLSSEYLDEEIPRRKFTAFASGSQGTPNTFRPYLHLAYVPGTRTLAVAQGYSLHLFDFTAPRPSREIQLPTFVDAAHYLDSPPATAWMGGSRVLIMSGNREKEVRTYQLWDVVTAKPVGNPFTPDGWLLGTSEDNRYAIVTFATATRLLDIDNGVYLPAEFPAIETYGATPAYSSRFRTFIAENYNSSEDGPSADIWTIEDGKTTHRVIKSGCNGNFRLSPDGRYLVFYNCPGTIDGLNYWDLATLKPVKLTREQGLAAGGMAAFHGTVSLAFDDPGDFVDSRSGWIIAGDGPPTAILNFLDTNQRRTTIVGDKAYYIDYQHRLTTYSLDPAIGLRGGDLVKLACKRTLPEQLSRFSADDFRRTPVLNPKRDRDVCGR